MKKISVIIPFYNVEQYLAECLESVVNQTFKDIEIILIDDCSPDNSIKIAEEFAKKDSRIKIVKHTKNQGLGPARNTGMDAASGEYIFFLDSDDYLNKEILEKLYNKIVDTSADVVFSQTVTYTDLKDKKTIDRVAELNKWLDCSNKKDFCVDINNFEDIISGLNCVSWGKLYSKEFLIKNKLRFINDKVIHEDNGFWLKICSQFPKLAFIKDIGVYYRIRNNAITTEIDRKKNLNKKHKHMKLALADAFTYLRENVNSDLYNLLIAQIKNSGEYGKYFYIKFGFLFKFNWLKNNKNLSILGIPIFKEKIKNNKYKTRKILGIRVYKKVVGSL